MLRFMCCSVAGACWPWRRWAKREKCWRIQLPFTNCFRKDSQGSWMNLFPIGVCWNKNPMCNSCCIAEALFGSSHGPMKCYWWLQAARRYECLVIFLWSLWSASHLCRMRPAFSINVIHFFTNATEFSLDQRLDCHVYLNGTHWSFYGQLVVLSICTNRASDSVRGSIP